MSISNTFFSTVYTCKFYFEKNSLFLSIREKIFFQLFRKHEKSFDFLDFDLVQQNAH